ncbi:GNAT family N-acetyltransferase [Roseitranquillus sediminis]|uniref:GNAT family N-acetyltransferase n=1 Tax=Roseitranquillus sediminis TaxID=2809051 RepID=UPI001D0C472E|nr:GNAT family N-acetyltransferase [Roseitranquillus sediminis]MBM9595321.1 GNAT family N-acetyltransferase [Roseitranquillus sediminis]
MAATLTVRVARPNDLQTLDTMFARSYPALLKNDYPPSIMVTAVPVIARANPRLLASGTYYVVQSDGDIVGGGGWTRAAPVGPTRSKTAHVRHLVTDHRRTREGIGRTLIERIIADAAASGARTLECHSTRTARPFYAACGFRELDRIDVPLGAGIVFPAIRMIRRL